MNAEPQSLKALQAEYHCPARRHHPAAGTSKPSYLLDIGQVFMPAWLAHSSKTGPVVRTFTHVPFWQAGVQVCGFTSHCDVSGRVPLAPEMKARTALKIGLLSGNTWLVMVPPAWHSFGTNVLVPGQQQQHVHSGRRNDMQGDQRMQGCVFATLTATSQPPTSSTVGDSNGCA